MQFDLSQCTTNVPKFSAVCGNKGTRRVDSSIKKRPVPRRAAKLKTYLTTIEHSCHCPGRGCNEFGGRCRKVKQFLQHLRACNFRGHATGQFTRAELRRCIPECWRCAKIASLLQLHAATCTNDCCSVCTDFRHFIYPAILQRKCPRILMPPPPPRCPLKEMQEKAHSPRDRDLCKSVENIVSPDVSRCAGDFVPVIIPGKAVLSESPTGVEDFL
jgi:hypothetical protein